MIFYQPWHLAFGGIKRAKWRTAKDNEEKQGRKEKMGFGKREEETEQSASAQKRWQVGVQTKLEPLSPLHASEHAALLFPSLLQSSITPGSRPAKTTDFLKDHFSNHYAYDTKEPQV